MPAEINVIVTGASRGIGLSATRVLLENYRANVVAMSRTETPALIDLAQKYRGSLIIYKGDVAKDEDNKEAVRLALQAFNGRLDGLLLNAGILPPLARLADVDLDAFQQNFRVNTLSLVSILKHAIPSLRQSHGRVIMVSSGASIGGTPGWGAYSASKAALNSICRTLAQEEPDLTTVSIRPGLVDTEMQAEIRSDGISVMTPQDGKRFIDLHSEAKLMSPDVAGSILATLVYKAETSLTGQFLSWDSDELKSYRAAPPS